MSSKKPFQISYAIAIRPTCSHMMAKMIRSSRAEVFCKKGVLRNFTKFIRKFLCQSLFFFNKVTGLFCNFIKKETLAQVFSCEFCEISKKTFFTEPLWWLLLNDPSVQVRVFCRLEPVKIKMTRFCIIKNIHRSLADYRLNINSVQDFALRKTKSGRITT